MDHSAIKPSNMMEQIFLLMAEKKASDVYLSTYASETIRINGVCSPINNQPLLPEAILNILLDVVPNARIEGLKKQAN